MEKNCLRNLNLFLKELASYSSHIFLFFNFPILKSDVWRYRLDNTYTRFRALDQFCFADPQFSYIFENNIKKKLFIYCNHETINLIIRKFFDSDMESRYKYIQNS